MTKSLFMPKITKRTRIKQLPTLTIVMQGSLKLEENFTYETLKIYQKNFPNCPKILSTWKTEDAEEIQKIKDLGVNILLNDPPPRKHSKVA